MTITLPIPPKELSPNGRFHWATKARKVRSYRERAYSMAMWMHNPSLLKVPSHTRATSQVRWFTKTKRRPDSDNALSSLKAAFDGITDSGFLSDDKGLTHLPIIFAVDKQNPRVEITITPTP